MSASGAEAEGSPSEAARSASWLRRATRGAAPPIAALILVVSLASIWQERCGPTNALDVYEATTRSDTEAVDTAMAWFEAHATGGLDADTLRDWIAWSPATSNLAPVRFADRATMPADVARAHWGAMATLGHGVDRAAVLSGASRHSDAERERLRCLLAGENATGRPPVPDAVPDVPAAVLERALAAMDAEPEWPPATAAWRAVEPERVTRPDVAAAAIAAALRARDQREDAALWTRRAQQAHTSFSSASDCEPD